MYICPECEAVFERPGVRKDDHGVTGGYELIDICPRCGNDELFEAGECRECGKYYPAYQLTECFCDECLAIERDAFFAELRTRYGAERLYAISVSMEGHAIDYPDPQASEKYDIGAA